MVDHDGGRELSSTLTLSASSIDQKDTGVTFMGDFTNYALINIQHYGAEMGVLMVLQFCFFIILMGKLNGRPLRMVQWAHFQDFEILGNIIKPARWITYISIIGYSYLVFPFVTLFLWFAVLLKDAYKLSDLPGFESDYTNPRIMGAVSVLLVGTAMISFMLVMMKIQWNNYRFKMSHMLILLFSISLFTAWQFTITFASTYNKFNFQAVSVVFLTQSGIIATIAVYINLYENKFNLGYFLHKFMKKGKKQDAPDPERTEDLIAEIEAQKADDDWMPTMYDVFDMITIGKISEKRMLNAFGAGFQSLTLARSRCCNISLHLTLAILYLGILAIYSYIVYDHDDGSKLGIVSSAAVVINDIYIVLMYNARIIDRISVMSLIIFCSRLFILLGGSHFWIYGYLVIYVWLQIIIAMGIVRQRLPFNSQIDLRENKTIKKTHFLDVARVPECIFILITVSIVVSIAVAESMEPKGVYLSPIELGDDSLTYWAATALAILIVVTVLFVVAWMRAFKRRLDQTVSTTYVYLCSRPIDQYYIICIITYAVSIFWTLGFYGAYPYHSVLLVGLMTPAIGFFFFNIIEIYIRNSYFFLVDTDGINRSIVAHNKRVDDIKARGREIRKVILEEGPETIYGDENAKLVKKVMDIEIARRQAAKLQAQLESSDSDEEGAGVKRSGTGVMGRMGPRKSSLLSPTQSPVKSPPAKFVEEESKEQQSPNVTQNPGNSMMMGGGKGAAFGGTMMGFKLDGDDSSDEDIDAIPAYLRAYYPTRIDKKRKKITTWQDKGLSWTRAFFTGQMRPNDIRFYWSFIFLSALIIILGALGGAYSYKGIVIMFAVTILHVVLLTIAMLGYIVANRRPTISERVLQAISFLLLYIGGLIYLFAAYDISLLQKEDDELTAIEVYDKNACINYISTELILTPLCTSMIAFGARAWRDSSNNRQMSTGFKILLGLNLFHLVCLVIFMFIYLERSFAIGLLCIMIFILYSLVQYVVRFTYKDKAMKVTEKVSFPPHKLNRCWNITNIVLGISVFIAISAILRYSDNQYSNVAVQSIVIWIVIALLFLAALARLIGDRTRMAEMPIYHSPWVFPIYKYYPKLNDIEPYTSGIVIFYALAGVAFIWAVYITVEVSPSWIGVCVTCALESIAIFFTLFIVNTNNAQYKQISPYVDQLTIKTAWCDAKENLARMLHIDTRAEYESYEVWWRRRHDLKNYMLLWQGKGILSWPETMEFDVAREEFENAADKGAHLRGKLEAWVDPDEVDLDSWEDCQKFMHETDLDVRRAYLAELETIIQFQLIILQNAKELQAEERKYLFKFIKERRAELYMVGINFQVSTHDSAQVRFAQAQAEIKKMSPDKLTLFNALKTKFFNDERQKAIDEQLAEEEAIRKDQERQEMFAKMSGARQAAIEAMRRNPDMPIDEMPDCPTKLEKIRAQAQQGEKFNDSQFDHNNEEAVYGEFVYSQKSMRQITGWKRASEIPGAVLFRDGASHEDITQGALGDCYFLSALSVLGNNRTVDLFACQADSKHDDESDPNHWKKTGCFMIKFFKNGAFQEIIVDDWIPWQEIEAIGVNKPAFTSGGEDGLEMWPCILEKAYAKLYGSYSNIEAGKVHLALADMVDNGFPEQFALAQKGKNLRVYQNTMRKLYRNDALMGAGTPEGSDKTSSAEGIVQGHAYALLQVQDYNEDQLVQLRNPHGKADYSKEWTGDWADDSEKWTEKAKEVLNYTPAESVDGVFWMNQTDFLQQFKYVYVCRELSQKAGWYEISLSGEWFGTSAAGFPGKLRAVPQFKLTIAHPTPGYLALTQLDESGSSFQGKNLTGWMVSREQGKLMTKIDKRKMLTKAGISNLKMLSAEVDFEEDAVYTIVCGAAKKRGYPGEGKFEVKVYTRDPDAKLERLNYTDGNYQ